ncbi:MAG: sterol desaturase family protein [Myxococcales bacterium]|jgi:sterol desaturase/sphingolipid hydroxylase (fatty acid hydroxylase superfamily)
MHKPAIIDALLTFGTFPAVFGGVMATGIYGIAHGWDPALTATGLTAVAVASLLVLERLHPYQEQWLHGHGDLKTDLAHNLVNFWIAPLYAVLFVGAFTAAAAWLSHTIDMPLWPSRWPLVVQLLLALLIGELGTYWVHRWMHENPFLWRFHAAHHSAPRLYWLNAGRFHPIDLFMQHFVAATPLVLMGAGTGIIALHTLFTAVHGLFQHCNVHVKLGPLNWVFSMAELHRWHHSKRLAESNTNYGANIIWWDIVFGSRFLPPDRQPPTQIGIESLPNFPPGYGAQLLSPFRWRETEIAGRALACYGSRDDALRSSHD